MNKINLNNKHFGDVVRFATLSSGIEDKIRSQIANDMKKMPKSGVLVRFEDGTVGLSARWVSKDGHEYFWYEPSDFSTIKEWAEAHS